MSEKETAKYYVERANRYWDRDRYETLQEAEEAARRQTWSEGDSYGIFELKYVTEVPEHVVNVVVNKV